jgi:hypothetical protein
MSSYVAKAAIATANAWTAVGNAVPAGRTRTVNICVNNPGANIEAQISVALTSAPTSPQAADLVENGLTLAPAGGLVRTKHVLAAGEAVAVQSNIPGVTVRVEGHESPERQ